MPTVLNRVEQKLTSTRKKYIKKLISFARDIPAIENRLSELRHTRGLRSSVNWLMKTQTNLAHIQMPEFPEKASLVLDTGFPTCAWQLRLSNGINQIRHGSGVQTKDGSVFEGVWNGSFGKFDFDKADYVFGSGVKQGAGLIITPPTHMFECVFFMYNKETQELISSNSLACCIAALPEDERESWLVELSDNISASNNEQTKLGIFGYDTKVMQLEKWELHWLFAHNLILVPSTPVGVTLRTNIAPFNDFAGYEAFITSVIQGVVKNGRSLQREKASLSPATCISTGYDSTAVTALGKNAAIDDALTLDINVYGANDCGDGVAKQLGVSCRSFLHPAGQTIDHLHMLYTGEVLRIASEFIGTIGFGDDILYSAFEEVLNNKMLFDGKAGDSVWEVNCINKEGLPVTIPYNKSLNEFRLRVGFAHIPAPVIGSDFPEAIARISRSDEMKPYSVGGNYDRPIPRRIVETAGATRESFGQAKKAANPHPLNLDRLKYDALCDMVDRYTAT